MLLSDLKVLTDTPSSSDHQEEQVRPPAEPAALAFLGKCRLELRLDLAGAERV